ncbi:hypothetical protein Ciccas_012790 [Cichlidogyrus casuarinus]|uniref:Uncharacterized protein n=1 Tax=Cichlidogyrus casuarinus TaxID=1844966 RepID=A0ABD2PNS9_9PLAT
MDGKRFEVGKNYTVIVSASTVGYGDTALTQIEIVDGQYSQDVLDNLIDDIGSKLSEHRTSELNFAQFSQPWSYALHQITLFISDRKINLTNTKSCLEDGHQDSCQDARDSEAKCWEVILQKDWFRDELFSLRNNNEDDLIIWVIFSTILALIIIAVALNLYVRYRRRVMSL